MEETCLFQEFEPKEGYQLDHLLCCTYGFDPNLFLTLLLYCVGEASEDFSSGSLKTEGKEKIVTVLRENLNKCLVLTAKEAKSASEKPESVQLALLDRVKTVMAASKSYGAFHPKLVLAVYSNANNENYGRLYIGSKNITLGPANEFGTVLDVSPHGKGVAIQDLVKSLQQEYGLSKKEISYLGRLEKYLKNTKLRAPKGIQIALQSRFPKDNPVKQEIFELIQNAKSIHIHSPWLGAQIIKELSAQINSKQKIFVKCLPLKKNVEIIDSNSKIKASFDCALTEEGAFHRGNSHSKIIYLENEGGSRNLVFGSANFTDRGFGKSLRNTEIIAIIKNVGPEYRGLRINETVDTNIEGQDSPVSREEQRRIDLLNSIFIDTIDIDFKRKKLIYSLEKPSSLNVNAIHFLIDKVDDVDKIKFKIDKDKQRFEVPLDVPLSHVSTYVVFEHKYGDKVLRADQCVTLPTSFYDARANLAALECFKLSKRDLVDALYEILDFPSPTGIKKGKKDDPTKPKSKTLIFDKLVEEYPLDTLAIRLLKIQNQNQLLFMRKIRRLNNLMGDLEKEDSSTIKKFLKNLKVVVNEATR